MADEPNVRIQWKGTDVCLDMDCECGECLHFDGYYAYAIQCPMCLRKYDLPQFLNLLPHSGKFDAVLAECFI